MKQVVQHAGSTRLAPEEVPEPLCGAGGVVVRTAASLISAGTEKTVVEFASKSLLGKAQQRPDLIRKVFDKLQKDGVTATLKSIRNTREGFVPLGYSSAGVVEEVGRDAGEFSVGDRVACAGMGYASHAEMVFVPRQLTVRLPDAVSFEDGSYVTLGAIALHGVRTADVRLGERVAVIGLGLLGLLTVQLLRAQGCRVLAVDLDPGKVSLAAALGAEVATLREDDVEGKAAQFTGGVGLDAILITAAAESNDPIQLAGIIARDRARVVVVGAVRIDVPRTTYYMKELELRISRSYGPGRYDPNYEERGRDYPIGYVRWTERRNMEEFVRLVAEGAVTPARLTTHRFPIDDSEQAYAIVTGERAEPFTGIVLTYPQSSAPRVRTVQLHRRPAVRGNIGVAFIGAGNFAKAVLLPRFSAAQGVDLVAVAAATGVSAKTTATRFGCRYATTDHRQILDDPDVHAVVIATRHDSHAQLGADALAAGKAVFLEKPAAIEEAGLRRLLDAQAASGAVLTVGFNRRFSPLARAARERFAGVAERAITYRVNAGAVPPDSWLHDPREGGGRIIGEACHFIDLIQYLADALVTEVSAYALGGAVGAGHDSVVVNARLRGGSVATLAYLATGDRSLPKERVEVYGGGRVAVIDDFEELSYHTGGQRQQTRSRQQQKGFDEEIEAFLRAVRQGDAPTIPVGDIAHTTRVTFAIEESLRTGRPVQLDERAALQ